MKTPGWILLFVALLSLAIPFPSGVQAQGNNGCNISAFTLSPDESTYNQGISIELYGSSNCGTVRFTVDGVPRAEIGSTAQFETLQTSELSIGTHNVCFEARGTGGWANANRECERIIIRGSIDTSEISFSTCPIDFARVAVGDEVTVSDFNPAPLPLRELPGLQQSMLTTIPVNTELTVINGPVCSDDWRWWQVEYSNLTGWVGEVGPERLFNLIPPTCAPHYISLEIGDFVQVTEGTPNRARSDAGLGYPIVSMLHHGTRLRIIHGPICSDGFWWWEVRFWEDGGWETGWTAEGDFASNWLESYP